MHWGRSTCMTMRSRYSKPKPASRSHLAPACLCSLALLRQLLSKADATERNLRRHRERLARIANASCVLVGPLARQCSCGTRLVIFAPLRGATRDFKRGPESVIQEYCYPTKFTLANKKRALFRETGKMCMVFLIYHLTNGSRDGGKR